MKEYLSSILYSHNPIPFLASLEAHKPFDMSQVLAKQSKFQLAA